MRFELKAVSPEGRVESLDLHGLDQASAVQQAESRGYTVLGVRARGGIGAPWRGRQARFPLVLFSQELLVLLNAGLPLVESIETLAERERRGEFRALLERVAAILRQGNTLSSALQQFPLAFPPLYVSTVQASEKTSDLAPALGRYVAYQNQLEAIRKRLVNAAIYPALLMAWGPGEPVPADLRRAALQPDLRGAQRRSAVLLEAAALMGPARRGPRGARDGRACRPRDRGGVCAPQRSSQGPHRQRALETARDRRALEAVPACAFLPHHRHAAARRHSAPDRSPDGRGAAPPAVARAVGGGEPGGPRRPSRLRVDGNQRS